MVLRVVNNIFILAIMLIFLILQKCQIKNLSMLGWRQWMRLTRLLRGLSRWVTSNLCLHCARTIDLITPVKM